MNNQSNYYITANPRLRSAPSKLAHCGRQIGYLRKDILQERAGFGAYVEEISWGNGSCVKLLRNFTQRGGGQARHSC